jgi:hypothetical protein
MIGWLLAVAALGALELALAATVRALRKDFPWLIVPADEVPELSSELIDGYARQSFDPELGWVRRPNTSGRDVTDTGPVTFQIDDRGCRHNPGFAGQPSTIAVFGDSYAFCRLTADDETFPHRLSELLATNVQNFGVGNYGLDQAVLRLERELPELHGRVVVMAVVPETMARVHSYWKHYFEYGNTLAFKPRFVLEGERLVHIPSAVQRAADLRHYRRDLARIRALDPFYRGKFRRDVFRFPHLWHLLRRGGRHGPILLHLLRGRLTRDREAARRRAFAVIMKENIRATADLYARPECRGLLRALVERFAEGCRRAQVTPVLVVIPQPIDLAWIARRGDYYGAFWASLGETCPVLDLTRAFLAHPRRTDLYVGGALGPHVSAEGNRLIAEFLATWIAGREQPGDRRRPADPGRA